MYRLPLFVTLSLSRTTAVNRVDIVQTTLTIHMNDQHSLPLTLLPDQCMFGFDLFRRISSDI